MANAMRYQLVYDGSDIDEAWQGYFGGIAVIVRIFFILAAVFKPRKQ
jgi:hypothetical protein